MEFKKYIHPKIEELDKIDFIAFQFKFIFYGVSFNDTELKVLAHLYLHEENAIESVISNKVMGNAKSVENMISKFRKLGIVEGRSKNTRLHEGIKPILEPIEFQIKLKINESDKLDKKELEKNNIQKDLELHSS